MNLESPNQQSGAPYEAPTIVTAGKVADVTAGPTGGMSESTGGFKAPESRQSPRAEPQDR
jgi:hypothetical protein